MYSKINTAIVLGIESHLVCVETDISDGMPVFSMVGYLSNEVKEAKERVRTAIKNIGLSLPVKRITINISPASIRKNGTGFDLPIAVSILNATKVIENNASIEKMAFFGEMGLSGNILGISGILPMVLAAKENNIKICVLPKENVREACLVPNIKIVGVSSIQEVISYLNKGIEPNTDINNTTTKSKQFRYTDFSEINNMPFLRHACEIAISGMHNLLLIGPCGSGKTFVSKALPGILPPLDDREQLELSKIYSVCGLFKERDSLMKERPFRSPHHTISDIGLTGGGSSPKPGEVSLAHHGILFLDEMLEFRRSTIEMLRQPLEEKHINIVRASGTCTFPADFVLVGAMNPCPCGYFPNLKKCKCTSSQIKAYFSKLSGPIIDRIDICANVPAVEFKDIAKRNENESSALIRERVINVHEIQRDRYKNEEFSFNSQIPPGKIEKYCFIGKCEGEYIQNVFEKLSLTARSYHKLLKVSRTVADMRGKENIGLDEIQEAIILRMSEKEEGYEGV